MQPMEDGIQLDQQMLVNVLQNKVSMSAVREVQMEAAIQSLSGENKHLKQLVESLYEKIESLESDEQEEVTV